MQLTELRVNLRSDKFLDRLHDVERAERVWRPNGARVRSVFARHRTGPVAQTEPTLHQTAVLKGQVFHTGRTFPQTAHVRRLPSDEIFVVRWVRADPVRRHHDPARGPPSPTEEPAREGKREAAGATKLLRLRIHNENA
eukprot:3833185-Rhodomonas_salina.1